MTVPKGEWEEICAETKDNVGVLTRRMKVQGGWLYRVTMYKANHAPAVALSFVPIAPSFGDPHA